ncbi:AAA family ATPase [Sphaerotilus montanus]|nr:AAA family ATPase [Sphaerotilus montanus]
MTERPPYRDLAPMAERADIHVPEPQRPLHAPPPTAAPKAPPARPAPPTPPTPRPAAPAPVSAPKATTDGVILTRASSLPMSAIAWLWQHWLACGKVHLLAGAPGQGKTTIALAMGATVSIGGRWPDGSRCAVGNVLMWSGEDDPGDTLAPRLKAMGADMDRVYFVTGARVDGEAVSFDPARDLAQLASAVVALGDVRLIVVDPIVSAVTGDSHKNTEVRRALQPLVDLAAQIGAAVVGITHLSKGTSGKDPTERVTGSIAFTAIVRVVLLAAKVTDDNGKDRRVLVRSKSNIGPDDGGFVYHLEQGEAAPGIPASMVTWGEALEGSARALLAEADADTPADTSDEIAKREGIDDVLIRFIGHDTVPGDQVKAKLKAEGFTDKQIRNARERVGVVVKRSGFGKEIASYWKLPDSVQLPEADAHSCPPAPFVPIDAHSQSWARMGTNGKKGHEWSEPDGADGPAGEVI